ncbi:MAG TPA: hypothetical protein VMV94_12735 [Phycisphaerae bacterium]|nr:hypothetical protein [Phycisphaerae bacterium]
MKRRRPKSWLLFAKRWAPFLAGGLALQVNLSGCDPEVRNTALTGIETALTTLTSAVINAFFLSLQSTESSSTTQPVVQAVFENLHRWLA